jgi:hypothetical protein
VYLTRVFDATSQLLNVVLLNGDANESISGRSYREGWVTTADIIDTILFWDEDHCSCAYEADLARARQLMGHTQ